MRLTKAVASKHVAEIESMRGTWIPKIAATISHELAPIRKAEPSAMGAHMKAERDAWVTTIEQAYHTVGTAFAAHSLSSLAERAGMPDYDPKTPAYRAGYDAFMRSYLGANVPKYVDNIHSSFVSRLRDISETKAARTSPNSPYPSTAGDTDTSDYEEGDDEDFSGSISGPSFDDLVDGLFDSVGLVVAGMVVVSASCLGPLASAYAFGEAEDVSVVKTWTAIEDKVTRPSHADADGQQQDLSDPFDVGGSQLLFPLDTSLGADMGEILYCRCVVLYDVVGTKRYRRPVTWADTLRDRVIMNLPSVVGSQQGAYNG